MTKCLIFEIPNQYGRFLSKIFCGIGIENYNWSYSWDDIIFIDENGSDANSNYIDNKQIDGVIKGSELLKIIENYDYYLIFLDITAFKNCAEVTSIDTYNDFLNSSCEISFIIADSTYCEFLCKDEKIFNQVVSNCKEFNFEISEIIEDQNRISNLYRLH